MKSLLHTYKTYITIVLLAIIFVCSFVTVHFLNQKKITLNSNASVSAKDLTALKSILLRMVPTSKSNEVIMQAQERKQAIVENLDNSTIDGITVFLTKEEVEKIPMFLKKPRLVEEYVERSGRIHITHADNFEKKEYITRMQIAFDDSNEFSTLYFPFGQPDNLDGSTVRVYGISIGSYFIPLKILDITDSNTSSILYSDPMAKVNQKPTSAVGTYRLGIILMNFTNDKRTPFTKNEIFGIVGGEGDSVAQFYKGVTFGKIEIKSTEQDVYNWVTIPSSISGNNCWTDHNKWANEAKELAKSQGFNEDNYDRIGFIFPPHGDCPWGGLAESTTFFANGMGGSISNPPDSLALNHELGHTFGLGHANSLNCKDVQINIYSLCKDTEYGDRASSMGWGEKNFFNSYFMGELGVLSDSQIKEVQTSGTYTLYPLEKNDESITKSIKIPKNNTGEYYYLDYHQPIGIFGSHLASTYYGNAHLRIGQKSTGFKPKSLLIDTTPNTDSDLDEPLDDGEVFTDEKNNIVIKQVAHTQESATIEVLVSESEKPKPTALGQSVITTGNSNSYITIPATTVDHILNSAHPLTIEAWVKVFDYTPILFNNIERGDGGQGLPLYAFWYENGFLSFWYSSGNIAYKLTSPINLKKDNWYHFAATVDSQIPRVYINGVDIGGSLGVRTVNETINKYLSIDIGRGINRLEIDELRISKSVRDIPTIWNNADYEKPFSPDDETIGLWHFENNLNDSSTYANNAQAIGRIFYSVAPTPTQSPTPVPVPWVNTNYNKAKVFGRVKNADGIFWRKDTTVCGTSSGFSQSATMNVNGYYLDRCQGATIPYFSRDISFPVRYNHTLTGLPSGYECVGWVHYYTNISKGTLAKQAEGTGCSTGFRTISVMMPASGFHNSHYFEYTIRPIVSTPTRTPTPTKKPTITPRKTLLKSTSISPSR